MVHFKKQPFPAKVTLKLIEAPSAEQKVKAEVQYINRILFEKIQFLQKQENKSHMREAFDEIKMLDAKLDDVHQGTFKIKNKLLRKELAESIQESKERTRTAVGIVR